LYWAYPFTAVQRFIGLIEAELPFKAVVIKVEKGDPLPRWRGVF
jgi:hypothetical protein